MTTANPYSAPDAELGLGQTELYTPSVFAVNGRIGRLRYLAYGIGVTFLLMLLMVPLIGASVLMGGEGTMSTLSLVGAGVVYLAVLVVTVLYGRRRLNDMNRSGWWFALMFVPIANLLLTIYLIFFPGSDGDNDFGPAPSDNSIGVLILGWSMPVLFGVGMVAAIVVPQFAGMPAQ